MTAPDLVDPIHDLVRRGGAHNRLVVERGPFFVVLRAARGGRTVDVEAAGGRHLETRLQPEQVGRLTELGLRQRNAASTFAGTWPLASEADARTAAAKVEALLRHVYRPDESQGDGPVSERDAIRADLTLGDRPSVANTRLLEAMLRLSKQRDMPSRLTVYNQLVASHLIVALAEALPADLPRERHTTHARLHVFEQLGGLDVHGVFTDHDHLRAFAPRELPTVVWTGRELFPLLAARGTGSLLINPRGDTRGELYRNEIQAISEGIARLSGVH